MTSIWHEERLLVDGKLVEAHDTASFPATIKPATEDAGAAFGAGRERALSVARAIRAGTIGLDGGLHSAPDAPFGGSKQSGIGREMGRAGFEEFLEIKTIAEPPT
jgi:acyl-CoA reductase-like NAD-dependent aldehyde dehydrogenase